MEFLKIGVKNHTNDELLYINIFIISNFRKV